MNGLQEHSRNVVSVEGLWREKSDEQALQAFADRQRKVVDRAKAWQVGSVQKPPHKLSVAWLKRVVWFAVGTVAWGLACFGVRHVFGSGAILLESVLLILILGTAIGLTSVPES